MIASPHDSLMSTGSRRERSEWIMRRGTGSGSGGIHRPVTFAA